MCLWQYRYSDELYHHGIKGQRWGVRRFQNPDGTLTEEGKKRLSGNKAIAIEQGVRFHRIGSNDDDSKKDKGMYVLADKNEEDKFVSSMVGLGHALSKKGKAYVTKYAMDTDLVIPSARKQDKIALKTFKKGDDKLIAEIKDTLASKGYPESYIKNITDRRAAGKEFLSGLGMAAGLAATSGVLGTLAGGPIGGALLGGATLATCLPLLPVMSAETNANKLRAFYNSIGDDRNSETYKALRNAMNAKGYNAIRDMNDKRGLMKSHSALILMNPSQSHRESKVEITKKDFVNSYIKEYQKNHPSATRDDTLASVRKQAETMYDNAKKSKRK